MDPPKKWVDGGFEGWPTCGHWGLERAEETVKSNLLWLYKAGTGRGNPEFKSLMAM